MARKESAEMVRMHQRTAEHAGGLAPSTCGRDRLRLRLYREQDAQCYWADKGQCRYKGKPMSLARTYVSACGKVKSNDSFASFEHVVRKYDGGTNAASNMALAHAACNRHREKTLAPNNRPKKQKEKQKELSDVS